MHPKHPLNCAIAYAIASSSIVSAASTIHFNRASAINSRIDIGGGENAIVDSGGTVAVTGEFTDEMVVTYTVTNLDFDGDAVADHFSVNILVSTQDSVIPKDANTFTNGTMGLNTPGAYAPGNVGNKINETGEFLTFSLDSPINVTLSTGGSTTLVFDGFSNLILANYNNNARHILDTDPTDMVAGVTGNANLTSDSVSLSPATQSFSVGYDSSSSDAFRVRNVDFSVTTTYDVTAVPEPSSASMLCLATCLVLSRRKRHA
ncbi:PEP-CTERM sorting domain-containing protein [Rubritalea marina]|uniref:PEP-CTERM sorting domain-containing protein n=1 Tax=Rubritalea marina TaxID=361055 RepID=UPI0003600D4F|nr:PEP-CTERM sorting domain-containing protein [Rubritalea marina]